MTSEEALEIIEDYLGILEILKQHVYFDKKDNSIKMNRIRVCETNLDFEILKDWLENE